MEAHIEDLLTSYHILAAPLSVFLNILIGIFGFIPSIFLTALNIKVFGLINGTLLSILGEALGAAVAFFLYRFGFRNITERKTTNYPQVQKLLHAEGKEAFLLIFSLRLLPFVPSGIITLFAALGRVSAVTFLFASTLGKIPAQLLEVYSAYQVTIGTQQAKWIIGVLGIFIVLYIWKKFRA